MERKIVKKILAILMIVTIMSTDFFVLGSNLISYAAESNNLTNNKNIEFSTYFKNSKGEKVDKLEASIKEEEIKLYAEITVKNEKIASFTYDFVCKGNDLNYVLEVMQSITPVSFKKISEYTYTVE